MAQGITIKKTCGGAFIDFSKCSEALRNALRFEGVEVDDYIKPTVNHQKAIDDVRKNKNVVSCESAEDLFKKLKI